MIVKLFDALERVYGEQRFNLPVIEVLSCKLKRHKERDKFFLQLQ